jgi:hypothetical protein
MQPSFEVVLTERNKAAMELRLLYEGAPRWPKILVYDDACHLKQHILNLAKKDAWWKAFAAAVEICSACARGYKCSY